MLGDTQIFRSSWFPPAPLQEKSTCGKSILKTENEQTKKQKVPAMLVVVGIFFKKSLPIITKNHSFASEKCLQKIVSPKTVLLRAQRIRHFNRPPRGWRTAIPGAENDFPRYPASKKSREDGEKLGFQRLFVCSAFSRMDHCFTENFN